MGKAKSYSYQDGDTTVYVETQPNGDELISEYGPGYQRAYVRTKEYLGYLKEQAAANPNHQGEE